MAEIHDFTGVTRLDIEPNKVLESAVDELESCVVIGYDKDGDEYFASSIGNDAEVLWLLERFKAFLIADEAEE